MYPYLQSVLCSKHTDRDVINEVIEGVTNEYAFGADRPDELTEVLIQNKKDAVLFVSRLKELQVSFDFYSYSQGAELPMLWKYRADNMAERKVVGRLHGEDSSDVDAYISVAQVYEWLLLLDKQEMEQALVNEGFDEDIFYLLEDEVAMN